MCVYLNINSLRYKYDHIKDLLTQNTVFIPEAKLDESFVNGSSLSTITDQNQKGGGVVAFLRSDIAGECRSDLEFKQTEGIIIEIKLNGH